MKSEDINSAHPSDKAMNQTTEAKRKKQLSIKKALKRIFLYGPVRSRFKVIQIKRSERRKRLDEAISYLHEWDDIPLSQLYGSVCGILKIKNNQAAKEFIQILCMPGVNPYEMDRHLPLV